VPDKERQEQRHHYVPDKARQDRRHRFVLDKERQEKHYHFVPGLAPGAVPDHTAAPRSEGGDERARVRRGQDNNISAAP
jgi:hypothetical protein